MRLISNRLLSLDFRAHQHTKKEPFKSMELYISQFILGTKSESIICVPWPTNTTTIKMKQVKMK